MICGGQRKRDHIGLILYACKERKVLKQQTGFGIYIKITWSLSAWQQRWAISSQRKYSLIYKENITPRSPRAAWVTGTHWGRRGKQGSACPHPTMGLPLCQRPASLPTHLNRWHHTSHWPVIAGGKFLTWKWTDLKVLWKIAVQLPNHLWGQPDNEYQPGCAPHKWADGRAGRESKILPCSPEETLVLPVRNKHLREFDAPNITSSHFWGVGGHPSKAEVPFPSSFELVYILNYF